MKYLILLAGFVSIVVFSFYYNATYYYYLANGIVTDWNNPLVKWSMVANLTIYLSISIIYFVLGLKQERIVKYLGYFSISQFWFYLVLTYVFNLLINKEIQMHRVYIVIIVSFLISFVCLITFYLRQPFKQPQ